MSEFDAARSGGRRSRRDLLSAATVGMSWLAGCLRSSIERAADRSGDTATETRTPVSDDRVTVDVGPDSEFGFFPGTDDLLRVLTGTTVVFVWRTDSHNIVVDRQPESADWRGTPDGPEEAYNEGYEHEHEFTIPGTYRFHCAPHETIGATGTIEVVDGQ